MTEQLSGMVQNMAYRVFDSVFLWVYVRAIRRLYFCTRVPHREGSSMAGPPLLRIDLKPTPSIKAQ